MGSKDEDEKYDLSRKIVLGAIFSFLSVVLLITLLHFYSRYLLRREIRRRRAEQDRLGMQIAQDGEVVNSIDEPPKQGLDAAVIASIPTFTYKSSHQGDQSMECSVCLGAIEEDVTVRVLPNCKHMFHVECIDMWLGSQSTCPICRTAAKPGVQLEGTDGSSAGVQVQPSAPPLDGDNNNTSQHYCGGGAQSGKVCGSGSRAGSFSFRRMLGRDRSSTVSSTRRTRSCGDEAGGAEDLERQ